MMRQRNLKVAAAGLILCASVNPAHGQNTNSSNITAKDLAERAVSRVRDQIAEATTRGQGTTWATQPGAVSVFSTSGKPRSLYKLYSAPNMLASRVTELARDVPADWDTQPGRYVDLNAPTTSAAGIRFPIADPRADAEGFSYESGAISGVVRSRSDDARLPMPVTWLYVLADGNEGYLDRNNRFVGSVTPTEENPIIGRYGFWTDDNTSRINVNTASEGVYWDTPRANTEEDRAYGRFQPAIGEYQRYPGHPARVSMSSVLFPERRYRLPGTASQMGLLSLNETKAIWKVARGIGDGGSEGGTKVINTGIRTSIAPAPETIMPYRDPVQMAESLPSEAAERVSKGSFFLTVGSRSADTNLHGFPRISTWPVATDQARRTPFDDAIAAVSTMDRAPYLVQRQDAYSRHFEIYSTSGGRNFSVYGYLQAMTATRVPGFSSSFGAKYGAGRFDDRDQMLAQSLGYIRGTNLIDGTNRRWKYTKGGQGRNFDRAIGHGQINPYCFCGGSRDHRGRWFNPRLQPSFAMGRMFGLSEIAAILVLRAETKPVDDEGNVDYLGEQEDLVEFGLWDLFFGRAIPGKKLVQLGILVEGFAPAHGLTSLQPQNGIAVAGGVGNDNAELPASFTLNGESLRRSRSSREYPWATKASSRRPKDWIAWGGYGGVRMFERVITFEPVVVDADLTSIEFGGSTESDPVRILLHDRQFDHSNNSPDLGNLVQDYRLAFPRATLPVPLWWAGPNGQGTSEWYSFEDRMDAAIQDGVDHLYSPTRDVIQSLVPRHGDYRLINGRRVNGPETFVPHPAYGETRMAHSLVDSHGPLPGATFGRELVPGAGYASAVFPDFPIAPDSEAYSVSPNELVRGPIDPAVTGDWDSGIGPAPDGAYNNKGDDGDVRGLADEGIPYFDSLAERLVISAANEIPHRMALPGLMGSLSTGMRADIPWQTLLFRPDTSGMHYGAAGIPDHLWLDLFRFPVAGPSQNSDAFSTDGKVNLNYRIVPFTYIHRSTALHAALKSEKILAIPTNAGNVYKTQTTSASWRRHIDAAETLKQWEEKFDRGELFRTASEICEHYLVPEGEPWQGAGAMDRFWEEHRLTADNVRERPYANLHAMLTTKSNSFEVHVVAQTIRKSAESAPDLFDPTVDEITGQWRGSGSVQRYLDPEDPRLPDYVHEGSRGRLSETPEHLHVVTGALKLGANPSFQIIGTDYDRETNRLTLTWNSSPGEFYGIEYASDERFSKWTRVDDVPSGHAKNPFYRGLPSRGYQTSFTMPFNAGIIRVRRR